MMKRILITAICLPFLLSPTVWAGNTIKLKKYYQASCKDYEGTWQGSITDPTGLFGDGGPWPITISLYQKHGLVRGRSSAFSYTGKKDEFQTKQIWAYCRNGQLTNIFWGKKDSCGSVSQTGMLVSKNVLVMQLNYENAMNGAELLLFLNRNSRKFPSALSEKKLVYKASDIKTCH